MREEHRIPMTYVEELFRKFGSPLMEMLGFKDVHCLVFFYLFAGKAYAKDPYRSAYDVCKALNAQVTSFPLYERKSVSARDVSEALDRLVALGWVARKSLNSEDVRIYRRRFKRAGRPPICVYRVKSVPEIMEKIKSKIREKERRLMEVLGPLSVIEEAAESTT